MRPFRSSKRRQRGLGLLEVLLAITVSLVVGAIAADQLRSHNETAQAAAAGDQLKLVGNAFNTYVAMRYNTITSLTSVPATGCDVNSTSTSQQGTADDPGPRCCNPGTGYCTINSDTLRRSGLLPTSFSGYNSYGALYQYVIRVQGSSPNYVVDGLAFTNAPYTTTGVTPRYDLLGVAMQEAGADSGMTRSVATRMEGLNGAWTEAAYPTSGVWSGPTQLGLLGYRVGYGTSGYAAYLRLDGASAMTGALDLGGNGISNVSQLVLNAPAAAGASVLHINSSVASGATGTDITDAGAAGGVVVRNDNGMTVTNLAGTAQAPIKASQGVFGTTPNVNQITANGLTGVLTSPTIVAGKITANNGGVLVRNGYGLGFDPAASGVAAGGWYMNDTVWLRAINDVNVITNGEIRGKNMTALDHMYVGTIAGAAVGGACANLTTTGFGDAIPMTKSSAGNEILQCRNGVWSPLGTTTVAVVSPTVATGASFAVATCPANNTMTGGGYALVTSDGVNNAPAQSYPNGNTWRVLGVASGTSTFSAYAVCSL